LRGVKQGKMAFYSNKLRGWFECKLKSIAALPCPDKRIVIVAECKSCNWEAAGLAVKIFVIKNVCGAAAGADVRPRRRFHFPPVIIRSPGAVIQDKDTLLAFCRLPLVYPEHRGTRQFWRLSPLRYHSSN